MSTRPEEIDIAFRDWFNQAQPLVEVRNALGRTRLTTEEARIVKAQIKHAFTHGYARGVADQVARPDPDHPELGQVR
jgi:hypothetical protein